MSQFALIAKLHALEARVKVLEESAAGQPSEPQPAQPEDSIYSLYERKFGKPPHHRMLPETIRKALDGG